jgi:lipid II:glycine glycyltransferase (peptidoglycan interpeptide bridge formation enzyme)
MVKYEVENITDKNVWEKFIQSNAPKTFLQSWAWGETNEKEGARIFRLGFKKDGKLAGACLIIKENARRGPHFIIPAGPILNWNDTKLAAYYISVLKDLARKESVWFVRIRPEILDTLENRNLFKKLGGVYAPMHLHAENTWVLDIAPDEEALLANMRKSTRYLIKKSLIQNLNLEITNDTKSAEILFKLQKETTKRHGFVGFPESLFKAEIESFTKDKSASVFICKIKKIPLACAIIIFYGDTAYYHFSASTMKYPKIQSSYFLQWEIIREAKKRGIKYYNFWGIAPEGVSNHRFAGVTLFKTGFGGERVDWLHAHDFPISPLYWLTYIFETARRIFRRL